MTYLMLDFSAVAAVEIDLGVVGLVDVEGHVLVFVISLLLPHCFLFPPHYFSCMGIVFSS
jgi:hypothetical protein